MSVLRVSVMKGGTIEAKRVMSLRNEMIDDPACAPLAETPPSLSLKTPDNCRPLQVLADSKTKFWTQGGVPEPAVWFPPAHAAALRHLDFSSLDLKALRSPSI